MLHLGDLHRHGLAATGEDGSAGAGGFLPLPLFTDWSREDSMDAAFKSPNAAVRFFYCHQSLSFFFCSLLRWGAALQGGVRALYDAFGQVRQVPVRVQFRFLVFV